MMKKIKRLRIKARPGGKGVSWIAKKTGPSKKNKGFGKK